MIQTLLLVVAVVLIALAAALAILVFAATRRFKGQYLDADGVRIHYRVEGRGAPVVLVHGYGAQADVNWRLPGVIRSLRKKYQVISFDVRGHGLSGKPSDPAKYGVETARDIIRLLDHLGLERAHVVGYSMGGFITLKLVTMYPDRLLSAAPCGAGWENPDGNNLQLLASLTESLERGEGYGPLIRALEPSRKEPAAWKAKLINFLMGTFNDNRAMTCIMQRFPDLSVTEEELRANRVPVLSIVGTKDPLRAGADAMVGVMANHRAVFVKGGDHFTTIFRKEFLASLHEFLAQATA
jgi:pimeloyl-ACP methyl ester carboxylesterase